MRKELFTSICNALGSIKGDVAIAHIDLWNQNVEYLEQEEAWDTPAVFVEFAPITWEEVQDGHFRSDVTVNLHVVTRWEGSTASGSAYQEGSLKVFDLLQYINLALHELSGETFHSMRRVSSITNHNHEEILENIEVYRVRGVDTFVRDYEDAVSPETGSGSGGGTAE